MLQFIAILLTAVVCVVPQTAHSDDTKSSSLFELIEKADAVMYQGALGECENILLAGLARYSGNDRLRFQLGTVQFLRAVEHFGEALYEYGAAYEDTVLPFLRLPVPENPRPSVVTHRSLGRDMDLFAHELLRAEQTLSQVADDSVKLPIRVARIRLDFTRGTKPTTELLQILPTVNGRKLGVTDENPDFLIHFDRGDVAWLRAYCHLFCGLVEGYRAIETESVFRSWAERVFPRIEEFERNEDFEFLNYPTVLDKPRFHRMRMHFVAVCKLNEETWLHIRKETDDDREWLPHSNQTDQLGIPLSEQQITVWLQMMAHLKGILTGEILIPGDVVRYMIPNHPPDRSLNIARLLDDPPTDLFNTERLWRDGIDPKYLEDSKDSNAFDLLLFVRAVQSFSGPFGLFNAVRLN